MRTLSSSNKASDAAKRKATSKTTLSWTELRKPVDASSQEPRYPPAGRAGDGQDRDGKFLLPSFMVETHGGGRLEDVPGFTGARALTAGLPGAAPPQVPVTTLAGSIVPGFNAAGRLESVHGNDDRALVPNTAAVPWRCICHLIIDLQNGNRTYGTGWFAGPALVVTAGHCIVEHDGNGNKIYAANIMVVPGSNGAYPPPFGSFVPNNVFVDPRWDNGGDPRYDYALLNLGTNTVGYTVGWFGVEAPSDDRLGQLLLNTAGYPFDKQFGTLWFNGGRVHRIDERFIEYMVDTEEGQSGSPVFYRDVSEARIAVAVHTRGGSPNRGIRITSEIFGVIQQALGG